MKTAPQYSCRIFSVYEEDVALPNGRVSRMSRIEHVPCVAAVPIAHDGSLLLIRQYRPAVGEELIEIPAGTMDHLGETPEECVQRELAEEIGYRAGQLVKLFAGYLIPGYGNEFMHYFLARDLRYDPQSPDSDECIQTMPVSFSEARASYEKGGSKTPNALGSARLGVSAPPYRR